MILVAALDRLIYIDDSGRPQDGLAVFGWVEFMPDRWASVLRQWLEMRKKLWRELGVPVTTELHSTDFINGRGRISRRLPARHIHHGVEYWKDFGREVALQGLETLGSSEGLTVGVVARGGSASMIAETRRGLYRALVQRWEAELQERDSLALVFMDGNGSDATLRSEHRTLPLDRRRVLEDVIHLDSRHSQLVKMADLVAWCGYIAFARPLGSEFAWDWYERFLAVRDPRRSPQEL